MNRHDCSVRLKSILDRLKINFRHNFLIFYRLRFSARRSLMLKQLVSTKKAVKIENFEIRFLAIIVSILKGIMEKSFFFTELNFMYVTICNINSYFLKKLRIFEVRGKNCQPVDKDNSNFKSSLHQFMKLLWFCAFCCLLCSLSADVSRFHETFFINKTF